MPRRRLHGRTQERRKKRSTRLLKRATSTPPVQSTQQPAPFERSPRVERDDLEFLETMRELAVERPPWRKDSVVRRQAVERVQFLGEAEESALFLQSMSHLGVQPLQGAGAPQPPAPAAQGPRAEPKAEPPAAPRNGTPQTLATGAATPAANAPASASPGPAAAPPPGRRPAPPERTRFDGDEDAPGVMEALLRESGFEPELKFAGAAAPPRRARPAAEPRADDGTEPDAELDLHGKTQEEAIRMVQNFLLVCHRERLKHVLVITGRGHHSGAGGPVLKDAVQRWLELNGKRFARSFVRAPARLGGDGAIWITLR
jgi:DNA-nicking Smr family endonuclease